MILRLDLTNLKALTALLQFGEMRYVAKQYIFTVSLAWCQFKFYDKICEINFIVKLPQSIFPGLEPIYGSESFQLHICRWSLSDGEPQMEMEPFGWPSFPRGTLLKKLGVAIYHSLWHCCLLYFEVGYALLYIPQMSEIMLIYRR